MGRGLTWANHCAIDIPPPEYSKVRFDRKTYPVWRVQSEGGMVTDAKSVFMYNTHFITHLGIGGNGWVKASSEATQS